MTDVIEIHPRDLTRTQEKRLQGKGKSGERWAENPPIGELAEELVSEEYGLSTGSGSQGSWWDAVSPDNDRTEVKSTYNQVGAGNDAKETEQGRFRLWKTQLEELIEAEKETDRETWIAFVLFDEPEPAIKITRKKPTAIWEVVMDKYGGFDESGHKDRNLQQKIPWNAVVDA